MLTWATAYLAVGLLLAEAGMWAKAQEGSRLSAPGYFAISLFWPVLLLILLRRRRG